MYSERTTIVDVVIDEDDVVSLNMTAEELYNASKGGQVLRRYKVQSSDVIMKYYYAALAKATVNSNSYVFVFDNGEEYDGNGSEYPELVSNDGVLNLQVVTVPAPSQSDEGKVLTVNEDDELEWAAGGSGGGVLVVGWTFHEGESGEVDGQPYVQPAYFELDKTWQDIYNADIAILSVDFDKGDNATCVIERRYKQGNAYKVDLTLEGEKATFQTSASSGYPRMNRPQP